NLTLPVSCVEQGRWHGPSARFSATATMAPAGVRRILKLSVTSSLVDRRGRVADQAGGWGRIAGAQRRLHVAAAARAPRHSVEERAADLAEASSRLPYCAGATGVALGIGGELVSIDLFDRPQTCAFYWQRLVEGAALEAIGNLTRGDL